MAAMVRSNLVISLVTYFTYRTSKGQTPPKNPIKKMAFLPVLKDSKQNSSKLSSSAFILRWHMRHKIHNQTPNDVIMDHTLVCFCQKFSQSDKKSCRIADNFFVFGHGHRMDKLLKIQHPIYLGNFEGQVCHHRIQGYIQIG